MTRPVVLFAIDMDPERPRIAEERLTGRAEILIRRDLSDEDLSRRAPDVDVLVTGGFPRDIPEEVWPTMTRLRLLQTIAAGGGHPPSPPAPRAPPGSQSRSTRLRSSSRPRRTSWAIPGRFVRRGSRRT